MNSTRIGELRDLTRERLLYSPFIIPSGEPLLTDIKLPCSRGLAIGLEVRVPASKGAYRLDEVQASATVANSRIWFTDVMSLTQVSGSLMSCH